MQGSSVRRSLAQGKSLGKRYRARNVPHVLLTSVVGLRPKRPPFVLWKRRGRRIFVRCDEGRALLRSYRRTRRRTRRRAFDRVRRVDTRLVFPPMDAGQNSARARRDDLPIGA